MTEVWQILCFLITTDGMCRSTLDTPLLPPNQLRLDVMRGLLFAHCPRFRLHIRAKASEVAYGIRLECTCTISYTLWIPSRLCCRWTRPKYVSKMFNVNKILINLISIFAMLIYRCWMNTSSYMNVLVAPVCISMLLNLLFLCNIVRVVLLKLRAPASMANGTGSGPSRNILQAFR